jgi:DNA (cytosine-5)-methyltransferase 1
MRTLSVFSGYGGLDLAAETAGWDVVGQIEFEPACIKVLRHWWPDTARWEDVRDVSGADIVDRCGIIDAIIGGPPCQPISIAGKRGASGDDRNMWPEFLRLIQEIGPMVIVAENPTGILSAEQGAFFGNIISAFAEMGYRVGWGVWGACDVENDQGPPPCPTESSGCAPHQRERVWILAYRDGYGQGGNEINPANDGIDAQHGPTQRGKVVADPTGQQNRGLCQSGLFSDIRAGCEDVADDQGIGRESRRPELPGQRGKSQLTRSGGDVGIPCGTGCQKCDITAITGNTGHPAGQCESGIVGDTKFIRRDREQWWGTRSEPSDGCPQHGRCPQPGMGGMPDGFTHRLDGTRWPAGRGADQFPWEPPRVVPSKSVISRTARIKMLGNGVMPQQAFLMFLAINEGMEEKR